MKKLLVCSHANISPENLVKPLLLAVHFDVGLVVPCKWFAMGRALGVKAWPKRPEPQPEVRVFGLKTVFSGDGGKYFYNPLSLLISFLKFRPEVVYVEEEPWVPSAFQLILLAKLFRVEKKVIFTWENLDLPLAWWQERIKRFVLSNVDTVVCGNSEAKELIEGYLEAAKETPEGWNLQTPFGWGNWRRTKPKVVTNPQFGVDLSHFKPSTHDPRPTTHVFTIGFVGRFVEAKGIDTLIEALSLLPKDCHLLLVSTTSLPQQFKLLARKHKVLDRVRVVEGKPHQQLPQYLNQMDVFVLPSKSTKRWKEQFGRVLIEAMACGVPVIGSSSGAIPEVVSKAGLIFEEDNAQDLADKIGELSKSKPKREKLAQAGLRRVKSHYTHEKVVAGLVKILQGKQKTNQEQ